MFNNVGNEIKIWAKIFFAVIIVAYVITAIGAFVALANVELHLVGFLVAILIVVFGYFFARLSVIILYAFGDLVENVAELKKKLVDVIKPEKPDRIKEILSAREKKATAERVGPGSWICMNCGTRNSAQDKWCAGCKESTRP